MSFELNNIDELVKQKITQKLFSFESKLAGDNLNIFKFIPYCLISNKKFQSKIHKITSEEREAYKTRFFALFQNAEPSDEEINEKLKDLFDDRLITTSDFDEIFPKFSLVNFDALLANILRINAEIYNVFEAADDSKKVDLDDFFYNLPTVDNSLLIPANYVTSEQRYKYYHYPKPYRGTLSLHHEESETWWSYLNNIYRTLNEVENSNSNSNVIIEENSSSIVTCLKLLLSLLFTTRKYNSLDTASFVYASGDDGSIHDDKVYINLNDLNFTKYSNCVFEDLNNESNNFDIDKYFDGYDNYQSSDEQFSVSDAINECCKFSNFLTNLYCDEGEKKLAEDKYSNLINVGILINHFAGFIELCKDLRSTFRIIRQVMSKSNGVSLLNGDNREIVIPSYNQFDIICKESVKEVIKDLIAEYLVKTK